MELYLILIFIVIVGLSYLSSFKEHLSDIMPPKIVIEKYLKYVKRWDDVDKIIFVNSGCPTEIAGKDGPWGYLYLVKLKNDHNLYRVCAPPLKTYVKKNKDDDQNKKPSKDHSGSTDNKEATKDKKDIPNPFSIFDEKKERSSITPQEPKVHMRTERIQSFPGMKWTQKAPFSADFDSLCVQRYGPNYGMQLILKDQDVPQLGRALCSRVSRNGVSLLSAATTPCMSYSPETSAVAQDLLDMNRFCKTYYPGTQLASIQPSPCPQPGQAVGICGTRSNYEKIIPK